MNETIERVFNNDELMAIIIRADYYNEGIEFFTPDHFSQQLAYMNRPSGYAIKPHIHNKVQREVHFTQEVLFVKTGKVRINFYNDDQRHLKSIIVQTGDIILLASGGHGFEMLERTELIEVKQGPYAGEKDKTRFEPLDNKKRE